MLIECPDCGQDVSDIAPTCPKCGRPIAPRRTVQVPTTPIEQTGKEWKGWKLVGGSILIVGMISCTVQSQEAGEIGSGTLWLLAIGVGIYMWAAAGAWWDHG